MSIFSFVRSGRTSGSLGNVLASGSAARGKRHPAIRRACLEPLENRCLMTAVTIDLVSQSTAGVVGNNDSPSDSSPAEPGFGPKISSDGHFIAFDSSATNLDPAHATTADEVYLRDTVAGTTTMVSLNSAGQAMPNSYLADITPDGRYVLFFTFNGTDTLLYRRDTQANNTLLVSVERNNTLSASVSADAATHKPLFPAQISADGNRVLFVTADDNMITNLVDQNDADDIFVRDINAQRNILVTPGQSNNTTAAASGNFYTISMDAAGTRVVYDTDRTGLGGLGNTNNSTAIRRVLLRNLANSSTTDVSAGATGTGGGGQSTGTSSNPQISKDGSAVVFVSDSPALAGLGNAGNTVTITPQVIVAVLNASGGVAGVALASHTVGGQPGDGNALETPVISADGQYAYFWDDSSDLVPNEVNGVNLYRYGLADNRVQLVTLNATNAATTDFDPKISISDDGRFVTWGVDSTNLDLSINSYGGSGANPQRNVYVRDMESYTVRLINVSSADPASAANADATDPVIDPAGKFVAFVSRATDLVAADTNSNLDVFVCTVPDFPPAVVTPLLNAPDVLFGGDTVYYFTVTYNSQLPVKVSTIGDGDVTVSFQGLNFSVPAKLLPGSVTLASDGTPVSATYYITPPGGSWDHADNSTPTDRYVVHLNAAQVADVQGNPFPDMDLGTFNVNISYANNEGKAISTTVPESAGSKTVSFTRTDSFPGSITVNYSIIRGTATPGVDYTDVTGTLTFAPGETQNITVPILDDSTIEGDETFRVVLSGATTGALFSYQQVIVTITDDDGPVPAAPGGTVTVTPSSPVEPVSVGSITTTVDENGIPTVSAPETIDTPSYGVGMLPITISRADTGTLGTAVTFNYTVFSSPSDTATAANFVQASGTLTFAANEATKDLVVQLLHDRQVTGDRTFTVVLTNATNGLTIGGTSIHVVVQDVDSSVQFSTSALNTNDDAGVIDVPVSRVGNLATGSRVHLNFGGNAVAGVDYVLVADGAVDVSGDLTFAPGESSRVVHLQLLSRPYNPGTSRSLELSLSSPVATTVPADFTYDTVLGYPAGETLTIANVDQTAPQVSAIDFKAVHGRIPNVKVTFNEAVFGAKKISNYALFAVAPDGSLGQLLPIAKVKYNRTTHVATVVPARPLGLNQMYQLDVNGSGTITDVPGNKLDGDANGTPRGSFNGVFGFGRALSYADADNDLVSFSLKGQGNIKIASLNDAVTVDVLNTDPGETTLLGSVTKRKGGHGKTHLAVLRLRGAEFDANGSKFDADIRALKRKHR
jgi:hypothetical protein